jgi:3-deoxy-D-manno-octulosonic-acid transferase
MPYDHPLFVNLFIKKTNPSAVFWVESEFWPISLHHIKKHNIPALALNFRMSEKSYISWKNKASTFIQALLSTFTYAQAQTQEYAYYFESLANSDVKRIGNLKDAAPALIYNPDEFENLSQKWCQRKIVLWASTHEGEEDIACAMYKNLKELHNDLLFIIVPRHPERGKYIASIAEKHGLSCALRSAHNETSKDIEIYIADTLGELGLFYALSPIAIIGNSFVSDPGGGHNMLEAAHLNCAILYGPSYYNFQSMHDAMISEDCVITVKDRHHLIERLEKLLNDTKLIKEYQDKAFTFASKSTDILDQVTQDIISMPFWRKDGRD